MLSVHAINLVCQSRGFITKIRRIPPTPLHIRLLHIRQAIGYVPSTGRLIVKTFNLYVSQEVLHEAEVVTCAHLSL
jgi:hypothetical protein